MRMYNVDCAFSDHVSKAPRSGEIDLGTRGAVHDLEGHFGRTLSQRFARPRGDGRDISALRQLAREPQRLSLAAAPTTFRIDVQHTKSHGAQHPLNGLGTQVSAIIRAAR
jgi:hypothetical protein